MTSTEPAPWMRYVAGECADGTFMVVDTRTMKIMGQFRGDMSDFAEDMRDRLNIRYLAQEGT